MILKELLLGMETREVKGSTDIKIKGIAYDSRNIKPGYLFICIKGEHADGHDYIDEALKRGASALIVEEDISIDNITIIKVDKSRRTLPKVASKYYDNPSQKLKLIGITGTNGKTTTAYMIKSILETWGKKTGLIGTISVQVGERKINSTKTTPESLDLQSILKDMVDSKVEYGIMETSSHALEFGRVDSCEFHIGMFTNLSQDHLDFHGTMENYAEAKKRLFYMTSKANVINIDDSEGKRIAKDIKNLKVPLYTYGINEEADIMAKDIDISDEGIRFKLVTPKYSIDIESSIPGEFSVYNCLTAAGFAYVEGIDKTIIREGIKKVLNVPGRAELLAIDKPYKIIIDYAHSPGGLENILTAIKGYAKGKIITVFGCGGDRDRTKRPLMGEIAGNLSDFCIITSDNPRSEDPISIIRQIERGIQNTDCRYICIESRKDAIRLAMEIAKTDDIILLAGKGHETYQIRKDKVIDFDEREVIKGLLEEGL